VDLATPAITSIIPSGENSIRDIPMGVGINPLTGRAVVVYQTSSVASIIDLTVSPPAVIGTVNASTGGAPRVAVSPKLNWAVITPGQGSGSLTIVDLGRPSIAAKTVVTFTGGSPSVTGAAINDETHRALLVDPTGPGLVLNLLNQTREQLSGLELFGNTGVAFNSLANIGLVVDRINGEASVIDPVSLSVMANSTISGLNQPVDAVIDPGSNRAVIVNQGGNNVSVFELGALRSAPHILQVSRQVGAPALHASPEIEVTSTLTTSPDPADEIITIIGSGFVAASDARLDGENLVTTFVSERQLTAVVPEALQTGPRRYALDVVNGASPSNVAVLTIVRSIDLSSGLCTAAPQGVAVDPRRNLAVVTNPGTCNNTAIINLATGMGTSPPLAVGTNPQGVAVNVQAGFAVVANQGSNEATIINLASNAPVDTTTNPGPAGVAIDPGLGRAVVAAETANFIDTFAASSTPGALNSFPVQSGPTAVAINPDRHLAGVANGASNTVSLVDLAGTVATEHIPAAGLPTGIVFDPATTTFLVASSLGNQVLVLDPISRSTTPLRVGINPTSLAYNFAASTLVTTNSSSQTMTVVDFLDGRVRAVLPVRASDQFAVDIHPFTNLAVIADSVGKRVLLWPLP
jgi:DNA-binding beta-propeller fold protein YncE